MQRLDYTRTGRWRLVAAAVPQDSHLPWPLEGRGAAPYWSIPAGHAPDACPDTHGFEVQELGFEKWAEIAPLFQRSDRAPG